MKRPLVITDCDEVLLHMVRHFRDWLDEEHDVLFELEGNPFVQSMKRRDSGVAMSEDEVWELLGGFFDTQMGRQTPIAGSVEAIAELQREADVVVLTNLVDKRNEARTRQLREFGITVPVYTNQGPKGGALARIVAEHDPARAIFIDDIATHHESARAEVPHVHRLHFCGEPAIAPHVPCALEAGDAHARIDNWAEALPWLLETLHGEKK
ncbi:HAD family hydrolase [Alteraurantiacibacter aquimixticola]|uniref:HAD family hydrolase n=1 Tax=Alteraurantiacibacter aquimixticola TaxID=2489173 RepID=A0A4T3EXP6_9SPHN|nr:HAD family hydrolase [Alteraurantiacibacter aquimixticola]TIX49399.1 HAD family hydrolase [Alteraurantiacibacter aquimixticola]